jgi:hypothetical protein
LAGKSAWFLYITPETIAEDLEPVKSGRGVHRTPGGSEQRFVTVLMRKRS